MKIGIFSTDNPFDNLDMHITVTPIIVLTNSLFNINFILILCIRQRIFSTVLNSSIDMFGWKTTRFYDFIHTKFQKKNLQWLWGTIWSMNIPCHFAMLTNILRVLPKQLMSKTGPINSRPATLAEIIYSIPRNYWEKNSIINLNFTQLKVD